MSRRRNLGGYLGETFTNMNAQILLTPLTKEELVSLEWVSVGTPRMEIPAAHIENLLATGYVQESVSGLALTDIGVWRLDRERAKNRTDLGVWRVDRERAKKKLA
jgi:hypothetical protein